MSPNQPSELKGNKKDHNWKLMRAKLTIRFGISDTHELHYSSSPSHTWSVARAHSRADLWALMTATQDRSDISPLESILVILDARQL